jgi:SAM-dependent methyltransferase
LRIGVAGLQYCKTLDFWYVLQMFSEKRPVTNTIASERQLIDACFSLCERPHLLGYRQLKLVRDNPGELPESVLVAVREAILAGHDPLGDAFCRLRAAQIRRAAGAIYTPGPIVEAMLDRATGETTEPVRVVDPGSGSGRFLLCAAQRFPKAKLVAVDIDPLAQLMLHANASVLGVLERIRFVDDDYRNLKLDDVGGPTLFIGNPPFVRHHGISATWKNWFADTAKRHGYPASKLAGLHVHFLLKTRALVRPGDYGAFIAASEWMDVNYGATVKVMLANGLGGKLVQVFDAGSRPFHDAMATAAVIYFEVGRRCQTLSFSKVQNLDTLNTPSILRSIPWKTLAAEQKWSALLIGRRRDTTAESRLGDLFRVHRGQVTGNNRVWIQSGQSPSIPSRFLYPSITRCREIIDAGNELNSAVALRRVIDLPVELAGLSDADRECIEAFLIWAKCAGGCDGFVARARKAWWSVGLRPAAPVLCSYMARRPPVFIINSCGARHLNIAHGLYPRIPLNDNDLRTIVAYLNQNVCTGAGRIYAGGLFKFEPKDVERLPIPHPISMFG